jgi:DNA-binding Lrp family transcriptional regulator
MAPSSTANKASSSESHRVIEVRDARATPWLWMSKGIFRDSKELGPYGIAIYAALVSFANGDQQAFPSFNTIANLVHCSRSTVIRTIKKLEALGWIRIEQRRDERGFSSNVYYLLPDPPERTQPAQSGIGQDSPTSAEPSVSQTLPSVCETLGSVPQTPPWCPTDTTLVSHRHLNKKQLNKNYLTTTGGVVAALLDVGFTEAAARRLARNYPEERIAAVLAAVSAASVANPAGWVRRALEENWDLSGYLHRSSQAEKEQEELRELDRRTRLFLGLLKQEDGEGEEGQS